MKRRLLVCLLLSGPVMAAGDPKLGLMLFEQQGCWACHGYGGPGTLSGPQLAPSRLPWPIFQRLVRHPARLMPAYSEQLLSDAQLTDIYCYLQSIAPARKAQDIPLLK